MSSDLLGEKGISSSLRGSPVGQQADDPVYQIRSPLRFSIISLFAFLSARAHTRRWYIKSARRNIGQKSQSRSDIEMAGFIVTLGVIVLTSEVTAVAGSNEGPKVFWGLLYTKNTMLSCMQPTLLPEMGRVQKVSCNSNDISDTYKKYMKALDDVLGLHELQLRLTSNSQNSTEVQALATVVDIVMNQTCAWVRRNESFLK